MGVSIRRVKAADLQVGMVVRVMFYLPWRFITALDRYDNGVIFGIEDIQGKNGRVVGVLHVYRSNEEEVEVLAP